MSGVRLFGCIAALLTLVSCGAPASSAPGRTTTAGATGLQMSTQEAAVSTARTITVSGSASVMVVPDEVGLTLGVESSDPVLATAKAKNDEIVAKVVQAAKDVGVDAKYVQTEYVHLQPRYQDSYTQSTLLGYWAQKNVVITLKDVTKFEALLSKCLDAGVNYVQGIDFRTSELRANRDKARTLAIQAAQEKAAAMAKDAGQAAGQPISIKEEYTRWSSPWSSWWGSSRSSMTQNVVQNAVSTSDQPRDTAMPPGQIAIDASVTVTYELK